MEHNQNSDVYTDDETLKIANSLLTSKSFHTTYPKYIMLELSKGLAATGVHMGDTSDTVATILRF